MEQNDSILYYDHYKKGIKYYHSCNYKLAIKEFKKASLYTHSTYYKAKCINNEGVCYKNISNFDSAFTCYFKANKFLTDIDSLQETAKSYNNLGNLYLSTGDYYSALQNFLLSLKIKREYNDSLHIGSTLLNMGEVQLRLNNLQKAKEYYIESLKIRKKTKDTIGISSCYVNLGILQKRNSNFSEAMNYFNMALNLCNIGFCGEKHIRLIAMENIGELYNQLDQKDKALSIFKTCLLFAKDLNSIDDITYCKNEIANIIIQKGEYNTALKYAKEAFVTAKNTNNFEVLDDYSLTISYIYEKKGNTKDALVWYKKHDFYKDSILTIQKARSIQSLEFKYKTQQKENEILKLQNENILKESQLAKSKYTVYGVVGLLLLIVGIGYFLWAKQKQGQKLALLQNTVKASEIEKNRIGRELHDGIAGSILRIVYETEQDQIDLSDKLLKTYNEVRDLSHQLDGRPIHGEMFSDRLLETIPENKEGQIFDVKLSPNHLQLREPYGTHIYRIVQELVTNNLKHAKASRTDISIELEKEVLSIFYKDNGIGMAGFKKGNGYVNMENRIELMNGNIELNTKPDNGFEVTVKIPYKKAIITQKQKIAV